MGEMSPSACLLQPPSHQGEAPGLWLLPGRPGPMQRSPPYTTSTGRDKQPISPSHNPDRGVGGEKPYGPTGVSRCATARWRALKTATGTAFSFLSLNQCLFLLRRFTGFQSLLNVFIHAYG